MLGWVGEGKKPGEGEDGRGRSKFGANPNLSTAQPPRSSLIDRALKNELVSNFSPRAPTRFDIILILLNSSVNLLIPSETLPFLSLNIFSQFTPTKVKHFWRFTRHWPNKKHFCVWLEMMSNGIWINYRTKKAITANYEAVLCTWKTNQFLFPTWRTRWWFNRQKHHTGNCRLLKSRTVIRNQTKAFQVKTETTI